MGDECRFDFLTAGWKNMKFWQTGPASVLISTKDWHGFNGNLSRRNAMKAEEHKEHRGLTADFADDADQSQTRNPRLESKVGPCCCAAKFRWLPKADRCTIPSCLAGRKAKAHSRHARFFPTAWREPMSNELTTPASNTFERIKRVNEHGAEFWSARELARVLEYTDFRNFVAVITKARDACANSGREASDHFVDITKMVGIGSGARREVEDWALSRYAC
jgi:DNA-damage-inducible protein D